MLPESMQMDWNLSLCTRQAPLLTGLAPSGNVGTPWLDFGDEEDHFPVDFIRRQVGGYFGTADELRSP